MGYVGEISTLNVQTKNIKIVPEQTRNNEIAPTHRVFLGKSENGAAWTKKSAENKDYLSIKFDDPSLIAPIYADLFDNEDNDDFNLAWSRSRKNASE